MKKQNLIRTAAALVAFPVLLSSPAAFAVSWTNWTSITPGLSGSGSGSITVGSETVGVSLSGLLNEFVDGDYYYNNVNTGFTSLAGTYGGMVPTDMIREWNSGTVTILFDEAVVDPYIALVSVGQPGTYNVNYTFQNLQNPISVVSFGSNYWGYGGYSIAGNMFSGHEFNGILQLSGTYNSLVFDISPNEFWHGFNVGIASVADPVPEPATMLLFGAGLAGLAGLKRRKKS